jgi:uncharacterized membrane protein
MTDSEKDNTFDETEETQPGEPFLWSKQKPWSKALSIVLIIAIIACIGATVYIIQTGKGESFTEFYILGQDGKADNYPSDLKLGDTASLILGIVNHEHSTVDYQVSITDNGTAINNIGPVTLANEGKWENTINFKPVFSGSNQKIEFLLYKSIQSATDNTSPLSLSLWINVQ